MWPGWSRCSRCRAAGTGCCKGVSSRPWRRQRGDAGGAGDQVDGQAGHRVAQRRAASGGTAPGPAPRPGCGRGAARLRCLAVVAVGPASRASPACPASAAVRGQVDHLVDNAGVHGASDDRDGLRVARGGLGVLPVEVARPRRAGRAIQASSSSSARRAAARSCDSGMWTTTWVSAPARSGTSCAPEQQLAGQLQGVVEPLALGAVVFRSGLLAEGLQDGADDRGALGSQVAADDAGAAERSADLEVAVVEPSSAPSGSGRCAATARSRRRRWWPGQSSDAPAAAASQQDPVGLLAHLRRELPGPVRDRQRLRLG